MDSLQSTFQTIPQLILNYLSSINNYIKSSTQDLKNQQNQLQQQINTNIRQESIEYLNENDIVEGTLSGVVKVASKIFNIFTLKEKSIDNLMNSTTGALNRLSDTIKRSPANFEGMKNIFLSRELGVVLGGTVAAIGIFVVMRRLFNKTIQFIKSKWHGLMSWSRGENY